MMIWRLFVKVHWSGRKKLIEADKAKNVKKTSNWYSNI